MRKICEPPGGFCTHSRALARFAATSTEIVVVLWAGLESLSGASVVSVALTDAGGVWAGASETRQPHASLLSVVPGASQHPGPQQQLSEIVAEAPHAPAGARIEMGSASRPIHTKKRICVRRNAIVDI